MKWHLPLALAKVTIEADASTVLKGLTRGNGQRVAAGQGAETARFIVIMIGVTVAFFWRALIRVALALLVVILVATVALGAFALTHPNIL